MEVIRRSWRKFVATAGGFKDEAGFRLSLAWAVLRGEYPLTRERRWWNRAVETPILVHVEDWRDERLLFSILVWPSLESPVRRALVDQETRARQVKEAFGRACSDLAWTTRFDTDFGLRWDSGREVWTATDGMAYEPPSLAGRPGKTSEGNDAA